MATKPSNRGAVSSITPFLPQVAFCLAVIACQRAPDPGPEPGDGVTPTLAGPTCNGPATTGDACADPEDADPLDAVVATQGELRLALRDVVTAIGWREIASGQSVADRYGQAWIDDDGTLARLADTALDEALLRHDCSRFGLELEPERAAEAVREDPIAARLAEDPERDATLAEHHLTWADVEHIAAQTAWFEAWQAHRVASITDEDRRQAWLATRDRVALELVDVPNIHSRGEVDALLAVSTDEVDRWYDDHRNYFLRPADETGQRTMRALDDTVRREIAQRLLRERGASPQSSALADRVRDAMAAGAEALQAVLDDNALRLAPTGAFRRTARGNVPGVGEAPELVEAAFAEGLEVGAIIGPVHTRSGLIVARVTERHRPDPAGWEAERDAFAPEFDAYVRRNAWGARVEEFSRDNPRAVDFEALRRGLTEVFGAAGAEGSG